MDKIDRKILEIIQEDASLALTEIAKRVGLSSTPCWRRLQRLESEGVIRRRVTLLDPVKLNVGVTVFVAVRTDQHNIDWASRFEAAVRQIPEVVEFFRMSGDTDYLLKVVVPDINSYDGVYKRLISKVDIADVSSSFALERLKDTTVLPLNYV
ncbi:MAG: Lrp/AsnC family transcriptional regulator [Alphaproteobacteria bacterium]|nr:Lrp/AsnC family transcriptional regulator [Alphaproteobacteria bacterium]